MAGKGGVGLLIGLGPKPESDDKPLSAKKSAAAAVRKALSADDDQALSDALQAHYSACRMDDSDDEE